MTTSDAIFLEHIDKIGLSLDEAADYSSFVVDMLCNEMWHVEVWYGKSRIRTLDQQNFSVDPHAEC